MIPNILACFGIACGAWLVVLILLRLAAKAFLEEESERKNLPFVKRPALFVFMNILLNWA
ncbi:MAG: hypothetical protein LBU36_01650 [Clostridiales bacterium]|jgi:hypothetical protein|nr:hypothetical protein [Clostridiales bacterium]